MKGPRRHSVSVHGCLSEADPMYPLATDAVYPLATLHVEACVKHTSEDVILLVLI